MPGGLLVVPRPGSCGAQVGLMLRRSLGMNSNAASKQIKSVVAKASAIVVAAEDHRSRARTADTLAGRPELKVRAVGSPRGLLSRETECDLLVFNCDAVGAAELTLFTDLRQEYPELLIVVVCETANGRSARRALDASINGLVVADQVETALAQTVSAVLAGQTVVPRDLHASILKPSLSFREKQILGMVVMGFTNSEIGANLYLAESTIKSHLSSAFSKLGVRSRSEAAALILDPHGSLGTGILAITGNDRTSPAVA